MSARSWARTGPAIRRTRCFAPTGTLRIRRRFATASGARDDCRDLRGVARLRPQGGLSRRRRDAEARSERMDGFISVERFQSLTDPGKLLSLSFWRDEDAVKSWRNQENHRRSQAKGRGGVFADYRLRIASVTRDYGMAERGEAPADSRAFHHT